MYADESLTAASLRFSWVIEGALAASARPGRYGPTSDHFNYLKEIGIKTIINLCEDALDSPDGQKDYFYIVHVPILDGDSPSNDQMNVVIQTIEEALKNNAPCLVHCQGGIGRTATVLVPVLMHLKGMTLDEALELLKVSGRHTQTMQQFRFLEDWVTNRVKCP